MIDDVSPFGVLRYSHMPHIMLFMLDPLSGPIVSESSSCLTNCDSCFGCRRFPGRPALTHVGQFSSWPGEINCVEMLQAKNLIGHEHIGEGTGLDFVARLRFRVFVKNMIQRSHTLQ